MRIGAVLPTCEIGNDPAVIRDFAQTAEGLGYDHIVIYDHVLGAVHEDRDPPLWGPYTEHDPFHEPMVLYGFLAAVTERIELVTGVLILPQRQTVLLAKQATEVDLLSKGRLRLGLGTGWNYVEYEALGTTFGDRARRLDEQVEVLKRLWSEPVVDFTGRAHRIDRAGLLPRPERPIPLWFGGGSVASMRRAARVGDGYIFGSSNDRVRGIAAHAPELLAAEGRDRSSFGLEAVVDYAAGPEGWQSELEAWAPFELTHFSMRAMSTAASFLHADDPGFVSARQHIDALEAFIRAMR